MGSFLPTKEGGRLLVGESVYGKYRVEWDKDANLVHEELEIQRVPEEDEVQPTKLTVKDVLHGGISISKSLLHMDRAPEDIIQTRLEICQACEFSTKKTKDGELTTLSRCDKRCKCFLKSKVKLTQEKCPIDKW